MKIKHFVDFLPEGKADEIAKLTDRNDHTEAILVLAKYIYDKKSESALEHIKAISKLYGHMPDDIYNFRKEIYKEVLAKAKIKLKPDEYEEIKSSF